MGNVSNNTKKLYDALTADGADVGTLNEFNDWFYRPGDEGYRNRKSVWDAFKADGADVGETYEEFADWLGLHPTDNPVGYQGKKAIEQGLKAGRAMAEDTDVAPVQTTPEETAPVQTAPVSAAVNSGGWKPSVNDRIKAMHGAWQTTQNFKDTSKTITDAFNRKVESSTLAGRDKQKSARMSAQMQGLPTEVPGLTYGTSEGAKQQGAQPDAAPNNNADRVVPHGVKYVDGKAVTEWQLPDGRLTTDLLEADQHEYMARNARLQHEFERRMKSNGLNPAKQEDVATQAAVDAFTSGIGTDRLDPEAYQQAMDYMNQMGLDPKNPKHALWTVTGDERSVLEYQLHQTEARVRRLNAEKAQWIDEHPSTSGASAFVPAGGVSRQYNGGSYTNGSAAQFPKAGELQRETNLMAAQEAALRKYDQSKSASGKGWFGKLTQGIWDGLTDPNTWTMGVYDMSGAEGLRDSGVASYGALRLMQSRPDAGGWYNGGRFGGEMLGDPITYISFGAGAGASKAATKTATHIATKTALKGVERQVAERLLTRKLGFRMFQGGVSTGANLATFEGLRDARQQIMDGGWTDSNGNFHEGFSFEHSLKQGGHGFALGSVMGVFGAGWGNVGNWATKHTSSVGGKMAVRSGELIGGAVFEGTIFAVPEIYEFHTMDDDKFDRLYAEKFGYDKETDPAKRNDARDAARSSMAWNTWGESLGMIGGMKVSGKVAHPLSSFQSVRSTLAGLRPVSPKIDKATGEEIPLTREERLQNRRSFTERLRTMLDRSPLDIHLTKDESDELKRKGYGELADLFRMDEATLDDGTKAEIGRIKYGNDLATPNNGRLIGERGQEVVGFEHTVFDGYSAMEALMQDRRVSQTTRAKAYYLLTGNMLPPATVTGYTTTSDGEGNIIVNATTYNGEVVTTRRFQNEQEADKYKSEVMRQAELNSIDVGEQFAESEADKKVFEAAVEFAYPGADLKTVEGIYNRVKSGDKGVTDFMREQVERIDDAMEVVSSAGDEYRPEAIRKGIEERTGVNVDDALRKQESDRTPEEQAAVKEYAERLFPEEARQQQAQAGAGPRAEGEYADPTPEQQEAIVIYNQSRDIYSRFEEGDPTARAKMDAIALRMEEARQMCEDAFGAEAEYYMYHINENPWALINDAELTPDQQEAVLNYINSKAALDGVMDASNEAADRKRAEIEQSVGKRTHKDSGMVIPATMKVDDRRVYVVKGNVVMLPDGTAVDVRNSSESVVVMDAQTGEYEFTSPDQINKIGESINPQDELQAAYQQIDAEQMNIFGTVPKQIGAGEPDAPAIADIEAYNRGYEQGLDVSKGLSDDFLNDAITDLRGREFISDEWRGRLKAYEYEQQRRAMEAQGVPEKPESGPNTEGNGYGSEATPLQRLPHDANGEPMFEQAETPEHGWDALVESRGGNVVKAKVVADMMAENKRKEFENLQKQKPKGKTASEIMKSQDEIEAALAQVEAEYNMWQQMAGVEQRRQDAIRAQQEEEARRLAAERAEEEARLKAEREEAERIEREALNGIPDWNVDAPADARARGYRRYGSQKVDRPDIIDNRALGNSVEVKFGDDVMPKGNIVIIEASQLQPSHRDGQRNPAHFLDEAQPKERTDAASRLAAQKIASAVRPEEITSSVTAYTGAPTVNSRGEVIQGNNRGEALRIMYERFPQSVDKYKQYLISHADDFGLTPEAIAAFEQPVLVNMLDVSDDDAITLGQYVSQDTESGGTERIKPKNAVQKMGEDMRTFANLLLRSSDEEATFAQLVDANGVEVLNWMNQHGYISNTQYGSAFDGKGNLSAEAANDLKGIMYESIFTGGSTRLKEMFDKMPAKAQRAILATAFRDNESPKSERMIGEIQQSIIAFDALMGYEQFRAATNAEAAMNAVEAWKKQYAFDDVTGEPFLPSETFSNFALALVAMYKGNTQKHIQTVFNAMYDLVQGTGQDNLFETAEKTPQPIAEAIRRVLNIEYQPITKQKNDNGNDGSAVLANDSETGQAGRRGSDGDTDGAEQNPTGTEPSERGAGTARDSRGSGDDSKRQDNIPKGIEVSSAERTEMESRIVDWLSDDNLVIAFGKSREEIFDIFGNELEPIAYVPARFIPLLGSSIKDARIYCGMGYFIDHALRNHGKHGHQIPVEDIDVSKYLNIQAVLDNPDAIKETIVDGKRTVVFIKKIGRFFAELAQVEEKGKIVLHKSLFDQKKEPYVKLNDIRQKDTSSEGGDSSISHEGQTSPAISLESRGDVESESKLQTAASKPHGLASERKDNNSASEKQGNGEKSSAQVPDSEQGGKLANDGNYEFDDLDTSAIAERIDIADDDWTEGEGNYPTYKRTITIDGKYKVIQVDEPDSNGFYTGSYFEYNGERFGDLAEVISHIDKKAKLAADIAAAYTITPTTYTNKKGKTSDVHLVTFNRELTAEEKAALDSFAREPLTEGKKTSRGWYDRKQGGYMMRSEEAARQLGEMLGNEEAVADAQPLSREDIKQAGAPAEKPARKKAVPRPANTASIEDVAGAEATGHNKKEDVTLYSADKPAPKGQFKVTDEMKAQEDELRKLLGIDDDEGSTGSYFRDPDELTPEQKRKVFSLGVNYAFNFLDNGVTTFPDFAKAVVGRLGSKVKPFIKSWYEGAKRVPGYGGDGYTETADVDRFDIENFDKPSPDAIRDAEMRVAERKAKQAAEQAEKELIKERNEQRKKDEQQTAADTAALAEKAEAVTSEAESHASIAGGRKPERKSILRDIKRIDDTLDEVNNQLAILGYYEAEEVDKDFNEAYGYMRNAEKKAVKDAVNLAKQLVDDLGLGLDKVTGATTANRGKRKNAVTANIAPAGGDISIRLPLNEGRELYITIGLDPSVTPGDVTHSGDNLQATRIMYRVEWPDEKGHVSFDRMGRNCWADANVTYADLLKGIQREAKEYLPSSTPAEEPVKSEPQEEAYHGTVTLKDGREAVVIAANHVQNIGESSRLTDYIVGVKGEPGTIKISPNEIAHAGAPTAEDKLSVPAKAEETHNGYKVGDEILWDRYGNGKWEKQRIADFDEDGRPILDSFGQSWITEIADWERIKPADGIFGEAQRVARAEQEKKKKKATADAVAVLTGNKSKKSRKKDVTLKPEQPIGDLFGGLFDEPISTTTDEKKTDVQPRPGSAERERGHEPQSHEPLGESQRNEVKGADGRGMDRRNSVNPMSDRERGTGVSRKPKSQEPLERLPETERKNSNNNHAERGTDYAPKGEDARIKANIEAIQLAKQLLDAGEQATPEQMAVLRRFSGWGGLGKAFNEDNAVARQLRQLLNEDEYKTAIDSRNSAYYTPAEVIDTMWDVVRAMGFKGGNVLEGSAGIGNILGLMPADFSERSNIHAVEVDHLTGGILSLLYPDAKVDIQGFEDTKVRNNSVDLAITNVPFITDWHVMDKTGDKDLSKKFRDIHDFCIAKNIRKLREGGIGVFITSSGTMDNSARLRQWITSDGNADVVGAFRMHNKTFGGTGATSDIIVVRKRVNGKPSPNAINIADVTGLRTADYDTGDTRKVAGQVVPIIKSMPMEFNKYFVEHPENMAGEMMFNFERGETWQPTSKSLFPTADKDQSAMLKEWAGRFADMKAEDEAVSVEDAMIRINEKLGEDVKEGSMVLNSNGELCVARMGEAEPINVNKNKVKGHTKAECFQAYTAIKKALKDVLDYQSSHDDDAGLTPLLKELNRAFDSFTRTYGNLHKNTAISFLRNDVDFSSILALETYSEKGDKKGNKVVKVGKTDIFSRRVIETEKEPQPDNIKDGILASLYKNGGVDVDYIAEALGKTPDDVRKEIVESGLGFENPASGVMEVSYQYLSGNVRDKLHIAEENNEDGRYDANIKALQRALPMTIPAHLIEFSLGSSWVDHRLYEAFVEEKTGLNVTLTNAGGTWFMKRPWSTYNEKNRSMGVVSKMCGKTIMGDELIEAAITNKTITVSKTERHYDGSTETITDSEATRLCATKVDEIRAEFKDWARARMQTDSNLAETIERTYNEQFNNYVPMSIPEEFVPTHFGGQVSELHGRPFALRPHQSRAVVRAMTQPVLLAHEVGTGKTFTLITTAMEMRRLGTARKPMIVVQNATVGQFVESAKEIYPNAKVLTIEEADRTADGRRNFYAKIKYNDWDMIVVPQSVFERIPDSEEREMAYVKGIIDEKIKVLEAMKDADSQGKSMIVRQAEKDLDDSRARLSELTEALQTKRAKRDAKREAKTRQNAEVKALEMLDREVDDVENFDDMGIDAILVDEAHEYKHLGFATAMQRGVKGVDPSFSKKSQGVYLKAQAVLEHNNGRNVVFATGTPISNTAAEIWTFMRYLMPADTMKAYGIYYFDDFVRNFGNISQMVEFTTSGKFKENNRFAGYINLPELVRIWSSVADTVLTREAGGVSDKIPDMEGGKPQDIYLPQTRALRSVMKYVKAELDRYDKMTGKEKKENSHIPLVMYGIAKAAAVDARLVLSDAPDEPNSKTNATVRETLRSLKDSAKYKGTVAIFADNYQNKQSGFNLYEDIRAKLIDEGVPAEQIVVIKPGMTVKRKLDIFEKVNAGEIRVIMGSTFTLGTGVNIQERLHTLIHVDAPNRPMDYTQRNGRALRQGNLHKDMGIPIRILRFGVEDSLDVTAYQRLKTKGAIADSIMNGSKMMKNSMENRVLEEEEDVFGDMTAQLSGSEYAILKNQAERDVRSLTAKQKQHEVDQIYIHNKLPEIEGFIRGAERRIEIETSNLKAIAEHWPDGKIKKITIGKMSFDSVAQMEDFFKEQNAKLAKAAEEMKQGGGNYTSTLPINIDGMEFVVTSSVKPKVTGAGQLSLDLERTVSYSCDALGIKDFSPSGQRLKAVMQDIEQNIVTGERSKGLLSRGESQLAKYTEERTQLEARKGNEFPFSKELAEAKSRLAEYEKAMKKEMAEKEAKYAELDKSVEAATDLSLSEEDSEEGDKAMLRAMEEGEPDTEMLESLTDDELVPVFRNVQVLPGMTDLASPMAAKDLTTGAYRTIAPRQWNGSYSDVQLTEEQQRMYDELAEKGYVMIDGKKRTRFDISPERYFEARATKEPALMFKLDKGVDGVVPASENPYDHGKFNTLNLQFATAYKRPNLVMVQSVMPKSELRKMMANDEIAEGMYHAPFAKNSTGVVSWTNGDKLALSRWSKIIRVLTNKEVAERINAFWQKNPAKSPAESADARDPFNYTPQVLERLQEMGWKFDEDKLAKLASRTPEEIEASYQGMPYVTDEDIARLNAKYADERHSSLWDKEPDEFLREAEENTMADKVQQMSERMNTPVRILRTPEEIEAYARNPREANAKGISRIERGGSRVAEIAILLPNNKDLADVENTFLHEGMGHDGLRLLFPTEKLLNNALDELYNASNDAIKADIDARAKRMYDAEVDRIFREKQAAHESVADANSKYYTDMAEAHAEANAKREQMRRDATEEYGANVAGKVGEKGFEKMTAEERTFWGKMKALLQQAFENLLRGLKIPKMRKWTDKQWAYIYHKAYKMKKAKGVMSVIDEAEDLIMRRKTGYDADDKSMYRDPDMSLEETITKMKTEAMQANADNLQAKRDAMRAIGGNLNHLRQAMARQREYDITTVKSVTDLAKILMDAGLLDDMSKFETKRILGAVNDVVGKQDVSQYVQKVMDIMVDNQLRNGAGAFGKLLAIRGSRVDARGIEVQGELDPDGQRIAQVVRKSTSLPKEIRDANGVLQSGCIEYMLREAINRMSSTDQATADEATLEYAGLQIARQYAEDITESKAEEKALRDSIKQAKEDKDAGQMTDDAYKQYVESTEDAIRQNKIERAEAYQSLVEQMGDALSASVERAKAWREAEKQRVEEIHHNANSDMEGRPTDEHHKDDRMQKMANNSVARFLLAPLGTFDQMLRMFGKKNVRGEGYLWNRYMRGWVEATEKEYTGYREALKVLDAKVSEIYGKKMTWGDLFAIDRKLPKASVRFWDGGEMKDHVLTQGNLLYIYMADKMSDGRMKLRRMGITEDDIENIKSVLDPKFIQLADWMQEEFLVDKRNEYNEVHKRMFGASMAAIENYFPLKILANARLENVDVADDPYDTALPATSTGSIIKRRRNNLALDVTGANAFSVILDHLQQMERWAAFAEFNRDLNTLLSYKHFRNQVMNMNSVYGAGKTLWKNFRNVCSMAAGAYRPPIADLDKSAVNIAKGVTAAKISFRVFTALKQFLSMPAYASDSNPLYLAANIANPIGAWKWSMENLPLFEKRWSSRMAGDPRLLKTEMDWKMWRSRVVELASRIGMSPNAFVDALTVAIGSHAMYQSKLAKYKRQGYDPDVAEERAKQDATILYNQTQQSSEGAFLSTMQVDRSWLSVLFTVFRNSPMSYTRQLYDSIRNIGRRLTPGYKVMSEDFMAKQMRRDGIDPDKADRNAKQEYRRGIIRDLARVAVFGYVLQLAWNLGAYLPYILMGNDDSEKDKMWDDVLNHTVFGSIEGLTGGDVMSSAGQMWLNGEGNWEYLTKDMPLASDLATILRKMPTDQASAINDVFNLVVQSGVGVNPQSLTDIAVAAMDYFGDDAQTSREFALLIARIINCPQSQLEKIYFDELDATGEEASKMSPNEIADRYARYKARRGAPLTGWAFADDYNEAIQEKYSDRYRDEAKERFVKNTDKPTEGDMKVWLDEYDRTESRIEDIRKSYEEDGDRRAYKKDMHIMRGTPEYGRYRVINRYKRDMDEITKRWMRAGDPREREEHLKAMLKLKEELLRDLGKIQ